MVDPYELGNKCTVRINIREMQGTGFFVAPGSILTCAHVVEKAKSNKALIKVHYDDKDYSVENMELLEIPYPDLALLRIDFYKHPCVHLDASVKPGDQLYAFGYPSNASGGEACTLEYEGPGTTDNPQDWLLKLKLGQVKPGYSGSPLFNMETWRVCGVLKSSRDINYDLGGRGIPTEVVLNRFPDLRKLQEEFHKNGTSWTDIYKKQNCLPATYPGFRYYLDRWMPSLHRMLTYSGLLPMPPERTNIVKELKIFYSNIHHDIVKKRHTFLYQASLSHQMVPLVGK